MISVLGRSIVALAALIYLPMWAIAAFGIVMIGAHSLFEFPGARGVSLARLALERAACRNPVRLSPTYTFYVLYPLVPWIGVMAAGYAYGTIVELDRAQRHPRTLWLGISCVQRSL